MGSQPSNEAPNPTVFGAFRRRAPGRRPGRPWGVGGGIAGRSLALSALIWTLGGCGDGVRRSSRPVCDPMTDEGCPAGAHCRLLEGGAVACLEPTAAGHAPCRPGSCAPGHACFAVRGLVACREVCRLPDGCDEPARCAFRVGPAESPWGLCAEPCMLSAGCSPPESTCAPLAGLEFPICIAAGDRQEGEPCGEEACAAGLACLALNGAATCRRLCDLDERRDCGSSGGCIGHVAGGMMYCAD